ncbi:MAG TPA: nucleotide exchange factor GrpE [Candidatus Binataceae bacterium]|nr:nucleotide exchange factor GrpE [Candidatus Binataceae bacterium]
MNKHHHKNSGNGGNGDDAARSTGEPRANRAGVENAEVPGAAEGPTAEAQPAGEIEELRAKLAASEKDAAEQKDKYLRALAESENTRKRMRLQSEDAVRNERERLLREFLPVVDNLERAVDAAHAAGDGSSIVEGVEMVLRSMVDLLKAQGVTPLNAVGEKFDPVRHEAADHVPSDTHAPNTVIDEFHRGYVIGDRVLRPARVRVARASNESARKNGEKCPPDVENR